MSFEKCKHRNTPLNCMQCTVENQTKEITDAIQEQTNTLLKAVGKDPNPKSIMEKIQTKLTGKKKK